VLYKSTFYLLTHCIDAAELCLCRSDASCGYNQLVYSSLIGLIQHDRSLFDDSISAARSVRWSVGLTLWCLFCGVILLRFSCH